MLQVREIIDEIGIKHRKVKSVTSFKLPSSDCCKSQIFFCNVDKETAVSRALPCSAGVQSNEHFYTCNLLFRFKFYKAEFLFSVALKAKEKKINTFRLEIVIYKRRSSE